MWCGVIYSGICFKQLPRSKRYLFGPRRVAKWLMFWKRILVLQLGFETKKEKSFFHTTREARAVSPPRQSPSHNFLLFFPNSQAEKIALSDSSFTVRFPASSGTLYYDPTLELILTPGGRIGFWRHAWFIWVASVLAVSVSVCVLVRHVFFAVLGPCNALGDRRVKRSPEGVCAVLEGVVAWSPFPGSSESNRNHVDLTRPPCIYPAGRPGGVSGYPRAWYR